MHLAEPEDRLMQFMYKDTVVCDVWYNYYTSMVRFKNYTSDFTLLPFGSCNDSVILSTTDLDRALENYVFPETRYNCKEILQDLGLDFYNCYEIARKTHGTLYNSQTWIKFDDDPASLSWCDVDPENNQTI